MMKKISFLCLGILFFSGAFAQDFTILDNPVELQSQGCDPFLNEPFESKDFVPYFKTYLQNTAANVQDSIQIEWRYLHELTVQPSGWKVTGICDNDLCRTEDGDWFTGTPQTSKKFDNAHNMLLEVNVYAPTTGLDGIGKYYVEVKTANQTDTVEFILTKLFTDIKGISVKDSRVSLYPNPASQSLQVFANTELKASSLSVYNIIGKEIMQQPLNQHQEVTNLNISALPSGLYFVRIADEHGKVLTSRKFTKN